jgi:hypothetical protein
MHQLSHQMLFIRIENGGNVTGSIFMGYSSRARDDGNHINRVTTFQSLTDLKQYLALESYLSY